MATYVLGRLPARYFDIYRMLIHVQVLKSFCLESWFMNSGARLSTALLKKERLQATPNVSLMFKVLCLMP